MLPLAAIACGNGQKHRVAHLNVLPVRFQALEVNPFIQTSTTGFCPT